MRMPHGSKTKNCGMATRFGLGGNQSQSRPFDLRLTLTAGYEIISAHNQQLFKICHHPCFTLVLHSTPGSVYITTIIINPTQTTPFPLIHSSGL